MDVRTLGLTACALAATCIVARIFWLFTNRTPVLAHSENVDILGETLPNDPLNPPEHPQGAERFSPLRTADMRVDYQVAGKHYEYDIETRSIEGLTGPDDLPILWADPKNPLRIERHGPGFWAIALIVVGLAASAIYQYS